jgi:hypothetical protein
MVFAALTRHPESYSPLVHDTEVCVRWADEGSLGLKYVVKGSVAHLKIPSPVPPRRRDRLWEHTCFEAFIALKARTAYYEFNFSPSGEWAAYAFREYRDGAALEDEQLNPEISLSGAKGYFELNAVIRLACLSEIQPTAVTRLGLSAVIEDIDGKLSYWALKHPPGKPDFHDPDAWALEMPPPAVDAAGDPAYTFKS